MLRPGQFFFSPVAHAPGSPTMKNKRSWNRTGSGDTHIGGDYTDDEMEFIKAMDRFRREKKRRFPTCRDILSVIRELGYRKIEASKEQGIGNREKQSPVPLTSTS
jgi:hypothetical protein